MREDTRWRILVNAIEFSPGPDGGVSFAKFFNFDPATGRRQLTVDLDGRGEKFMPGPCLTCHGGRGDALAPDAKPPGMLLFNLVQNAASNTRGDTQANSLHSKSTTSISRHCLDTLDPTRRPGSRP